MPTLLTNVNHKGTVYAAGTTPPTEVSDQLRNPRLWTGGVVPALSAPVPETAISLSGLTATQIRAALGVGTVSTGVAVRNNSASVVNTVDRDGCSGSATLVAGTAYAQHFTPSQPMTVTKIGFATAATPASGANSLIRFGLFVVNEDLTLTLVARTASDLTLLQSANTLYRKVLATAGGFPASYTLVPGTRYATGLIVVGGVAGTLAAPAAVIAALLADEPRLCSTLGSSQADLPTVATAPSGTGALRFLSQVTTS